MRFGVNLMLVVLLWALWKAGFFKWLGKTFGEKEMRTAFLVFCGILVGYTTVMLLFKIPMSIDLFFDTDMTKLYHIFSNPFTYNNSLFADVARRPFPLFLTLPFGLLTPVISDLSVRLYMVVLSALNIAMFSLLVSRIAPKARAFNMLLCAAFAVSAPQIFFGALGVEQYLHIQFGMMICMLYFSFAIPQKRYKEWELLLVAAICLVANSVILPMFGIFYITLLCVLDKPRGVFMRIIRMAIMFVILHHLLAFFQSLILPWVNSYVWNMFAFAPKGLDFTANSSFFAFNKHIGFPNPWKYITDVLSMPFGFDNIKRAPIFSYLWIWAVALIPCIVSNRKNPLFLAILGSWLSFVLFFAIYNPHNTFLYSIMHITVLFAMLAYFPKFKTEVAVIMLTVLLIINAPWVKYINFSARVFQNNGITYGGQVGLMRFNADNSMAQRFGPLCYDKWRILKLTMEQREQKEQQEKQAK